MRHPHGAIVVAALIFGAAMPIVGAGGAGLSPASASALTTLSGTVATDTVHSTELPGATVDALSAADHTVAASTVTDAVGNYALRVPNGTFDLHIVPPAAGSYAPATIKAIAVNGPTVVNPILTRAVATPDTGHVFEADGVTPVAAQVCSASIGASWGDGECVPVGASGAFSVPTNPDFPLYVIDARNVIPGAIWTLFPPGGAPPGSSHDFVLPIHSLAVTVHAVGGGVVAGAQVEEVTPQPVAAGLNYQDSRYPPDVTGPTATSDANGVARLLIYGGTGATLRVVSPSGAQYLAANLDFTTATTLAVTVPAQVTYAGTLTQADGVAPVADLICLIPSPDQFQGEYGLWQQTCVQADAHGAFTMSVPPGSYTRAVTFPGADGGQISNSTPVALTASVTGPLVLPVRNLTVSAVDTGGQPVAGAGVFVLSKGGSAAANGWTTGGTEVSAATGSNGTVTVPVFAPANEAVQVQAPANANAFGIATKGFAQDDANASMQLVLGPPVTFSGRLLGADGATPVSGEVCLEPYTDANFFSALPISIPICSGAAADGSFAVNVAIGSYVVKITRPGGVLVQVSDRTFGQVRMTKSLDQDLVIPVRSVKLKVVDAAGNPVPGAHVGFGNSWQNSAGPWLLGGAFSVTAAGTINVSTGADGTVVVPAYAATPNNAEHAEANISVEPPATMTGMGKVAIQEIPLVGDGTFAVVLGGLVEPQTGIPAAGGTGGAYPTGYPPAIVNTVAVAAGQPDTFYGDNNPFAPGSWTLTITSPVAGNVRFTNSATASAAPGYTFLGGVTEVVAPSIDVSSPVRVAVTMNVAGTAGAADPSAVAAFGANGLIPACAAAGVASPDPCVAASSTSGVIDTITVQSSHGAALELEAPTSSGGGSGSGGGSAGGSGGGSGGGGSGSGATVTRVFGADRFATAAAISRTAFPSGGATAVVLTSAGSYPDAVVGAPLAARLNAPILLTSGARLPAVTATEIQRVLVAGGTVDILGGSMAVPSSVQSELAALGYHTIRIAGSNRYATAVAVADALGDPSTVLLASGTSFPDALAAGPAAAHVSGAVLLTAGGTLSAETSAYLAAHAKTVYAVGGPAAQADPAAQGINGTDRYATAVAVADRFFPQATLAGIASGESFPDALTAGTLLVHNGSPLLLTGQSILPATTSSYLSALASPTDQVYLFGGSGVISTSVAQSITAAAGS